MDITTINTIIGTAATFIGAAILFVLGAIVTYVRSINASMKDLLVMSTEHRTKITMHDQQIADLYDKFNSLKHK